MTYQEALQTQQAQEWTIRQIGNSWQPLHEGTPIGIAHPTPEAARIFILCQIQYELDAPRREAEKNRLYRDFDLC